MLGTILLRNIQQQLAIESSCKRRKVELPILHGDELHNRQCAWLEGSNSSSPSWRPIKHWCWALDNQLQTMTCCGLAASSFPNILNSYGDRWREWPCAALSIDCGSDGLCGYHYCVCSPLKLAMFFIPDESHNIQNSFFEMVKAIKAYDVLLLLLITFNTEMGPKKVKTKTQHQGQVGYSLQIS